LPLAACCEELANLAQQILRRAVRFQADLLQLFSHRRIKVPRHDFLANAQPLILNDQRQAGAALK
jgi:hypothetical protein